MGEHESGITPTASIKRKGIEMLTCAAMDGAAPGDTVLGIAD
jgi:hypothetical protein